MVSELECICPFEGIEDPPIWSETPDSLGCPVHGPQLKLYCRIHHNAFYGSCQACRYDEQFEMLKLIRDEIIALRNTSKGVVTPD